MTKERITTLRRAILLILVAVLCLTLFAGCGKEDEPEITASFISNKLEPMSELVSAKMTYNGIIQYSEGNVPFFTHKEFLMVYHADVKAGIDLSKVQVEVTETNVTITIPDDISLDVKVDPDSISFYAEKKAIFNPETKDDTVDAIKAAEENVLADGGIEELKTTARKNAILLITGLVEELIGERTLTVLS